jgi:PPK2 family polyphosphate:nucleotide phosphotransferase
VGAGVASLRPVAAKSIAVRAGSIPQQLKERAMQAGRFRVRHGDETVLDRIRPDDTGRFKSRSAAADHLKKGIERLEQLQELLYAQREYALLLILQGLDASGKDSAIKHVMSGVNPEGTDVHTFKRPSVEELNHDYLWRAARALPERGRIGIFNRSHYEEVLVVRVHRQLLKAQHVPSERVTRHIWRERFEDINAFERHLSRNGTIVRKFFLHVSRSEQRKRLLSRLDDPTKNWKFSPDDLAERSKWHAYMAAYRDVLRATSYDHAPWYVIPADHKWFAHVTIADIIVKTLADLDLSFPKLTREQRRQLEAAGRQLRHGR